MPGNCFRTIRPGWITPSSCGAGAALVQGPIQTPATRCSEMLALPARCLLRYLAAGGARLREPWSTSPACRPRLSHRIEALDVIACDVLGELTEAMTRQSPFGKKATLQDLPAWIARSRIPAAA